MKKIFAIILAISLLIFMAACSRETDPTDPASSQTASQPPADTEAEVTESRQEDLREEDDLREFVDAYMEKAVMDLRAGCEDLLSGIGNFDEYQENTGRIEAFYQKIDEATDMIVIHLREFSRDYAAFVLESDSSMSDKYEEIDDIEYFIYKDAGTAYYEEFYEGIMGDLYRAFYMGVIEDAEGDLSEDDWSLARDTEYKRWSGINSAVHRRWLDLRTDISVFRSRLSREIWNQDMERAEKVLRNFSISIDNLKNDITAPVFNDPLTENRELAEILTELKNEFEGVEQLMTDELNSVYGILGNTYQSYVENYQLLLDWYDRALKEMEGLYESVPDKVLEYYKTIPLVLDQDDSKAIDHALYDFSDAFYWGILEQVKNTFQRTLLDEIRSKYYDGILDDARGSVSYDEWFKTKTGSNVDWTSFFTTFSGDLFDFRSDLLDGWQRVQEGFRAKNFDVDALLP
ncbi:MAG TPA: hypothetical protein GX720_01775 [Clostridiaceae bacterium]|nr:hypothetical protein [Clostridiaceae bacterium]